MVAEQKEIENVIRKCQDDFRHRRVSESLHGLVVARQEQAGARILTGSFEKDLRRYIDFQSDLRGFWRILRLCQSNFDTLTRYFASSHENDFGYYSENTDNDDDEEEEEEIEPPQKKQATMEAESTLVTSSLPVQPGPPS